MYLHCQNTRQRFNRSIVNCDNSGWDLNNFVLVIGPGWWPWEPTFRLSWCRVIRIERILLPKLLQVPEVIQHGTIGEWNEGCCCYAWKCPLVLITWLFHLKIKVQIIVCHCKQSWIWELLQALFEAASHWLNDMVDGFQGYTPSSTWEYVYDSPWSICWVKKETLSSLECIASLTWTVCEDWEDCDSFLWVLVSCKFQPVLSTYYF